ncbi:MAG TPA: VOC family protein [Microbacteriaceae bacterium]
MARVEHFEIPADDLARAKSFYSGVFGFEFEDWDATITMIGAVEGGIGGDIHLRSVVPHPTIVITVPDLDETLAAVIAGGGEQLGEVQIIDEGSRYAYFKDTEGNIIGVYDSRR